MGTGPTSRTPRKRSDSDSPKGVTLISGIVPTACVHRPQEGLRAPRARLGAHNRPPRFPPHTHTTQAQPSRRRLPVLAPETRVGPSGSNWTTSNQLGWRGSEGRGRGGAPGAATQALCPTTVFELPPNRLRAWGKHGDAYLTGSRPRSASPYTVRRDGQRLGSHSSLIAAFVNPLHHRPRSPATGTRPR